MDKCVVCGIREPHIQPFGTVCLPCANEERDQKLIVALQQRIAALEQQNAALVAALKKVKDTITHDANGYDAHDIIEAALSGSTSTLDAIIAKEREPLALLLGRALDEFRRHFSQYHAPGGAPCDTCLLCEEIVAAIERHGVVAQSATTEREDLDNRDERMRREGAVAALQHISGVYRRGELLPRSALEVALCVDSKIDKIESGELAPWRKP